MSTPTSIRTHRPARQAADNPQDWRHGAACVRADPELFFPLSGESQSSAMAYCEGCPVRSECLADALAGGHGGIRGGLSEDARRQLLRTRRAAP